MTHDLSMMAATVVVVVLLVVVVAPWLWLQVGIVLLIGVAITVSMLCRWFPRSGGGRGFGTTEAREGEAAHTGRTELGAVHIEALLRVTVSWPRQRLRVELTRQCQSRSGWERPPRGGGTVAEACRCCFHLSICDTPSLSPKAQIFTNRAMSSHV